MNRTFIWTPNNERLGPFDQRPNGYLGHGTTATFSFIGEPSALRVIKCISTEEAVIVNVPTEPYNRDEPDEFRVAAHADEIPYDWARPDR